MNCRWMSTSQEKWTTASPFAGIDIQLKTFDVIEHIRLILDMKYDLGFPLSFDSNLYYKNDPEKFILLKELIE